MMLTVRPTFDVCATLLIGETCIVIMVDLGLCEVILALHEECVMLRAEYQLPKLCLPQRVDVEPGDRKRHALWPIEDEAPLICTLDPDSPRKPGKWDIFRQKKDCIAMSMRS